MTCKGEDCSEEMHLFTRMRSLNEAIEGSSAHAEKKCMQAEKLLAQHNQNLKRKVSPLSVGQQNEDIIPGCKKPKLPQGERNESEGDELGEELPSKVSEWLSVENRIEFNYLK